MTTATLDIMNTPMAPYVGVMQNLSRHDIQIVVSFLNDVMEKSEENTVSQHKTKADIIREKYKNLTISTRADALVDGLSLTDEEFGDDRTKHILGL